MISQFIHILFIISFISPGDVFEFIVIDECDAYPCDTIASCSNFDGGFECACPAGYTGDGVSCDDIDECTAGTDNCSANGSCKNTPGGFDCKCNRGYQGDGVKCTDVNECSNSPCDEYSYCTNNDGSFSCQCKDGFGGEGACNDVNECDDNPCDGNATCDNLIGSFECACNNGYAGNGFNCVDINECDSAPCDSNATCDNSNGGYTCTCNNRYVGNGDECKRVDDNAVWKGDNYQCDSGYEGTRFNCEDINECARGTDTCDSNAACENTDGGYNCACNTGYSGNFLNISFYLIYYETKLFYLIISLISY